MISARPNFKFLDRGFKDTLVLIPGWAADYRIFSYLDINYNYLLPIRFFPDNFADGLLQYLDRMSMDKVSLFGWSLGGFLASEFAAKSPQRINELILLSIRERFALKNLKDIEAKLRENKSVFLYKFYLECFSDIDSEGLGWFRRRLLKIYLCKMKLRDLTCGLGYLSAARISPEKLTRVKRIRIFHGSRDTITPFAEALKIKSQLPQARLICLKGLGHIPFLNPQFKEKFSNG